VIHKTLTLTLDEAKLKACLLLSQSRLTKDKGIMEVINKNSKNKVELDFFETTIKSLTFMHCYEYITIDQTVKLLRSQVIEKIDPMTKEYIELLSFEVWQVLYAQRPIETLHQMFQGLVTKITDMQKQGLYGKETSEEEIISLLEQAKNQKTDDATSQKEEDFFDELLYKTKWQQISEYYYSYDEHSRSLFNIFLVGMSIFILSSVTKLFLRMCKTKKESSKRKIT